MEATLKQLDAAEGSGTSVVTLLLPSGSDLSKAVRMLESELATARNIKDRLNRSSVQRALGSALEALRGMTSLPDNGLALFSGEVSLGGSKPRLEVVALEPPRRLTRRVYRCGATFFTQPLHDMVEEAQLPAYGYIIVDGQGVLVGASWGCARQVLAHTSVDLPKTHKKGGQSAPRFGRLAAEARSSYITAAAELAAAHLSVTPALDGAGRTLVEGIIIAGAAEQKDHMLEALDARLRTRVLGVITVSVGGEAGMCEAMSKAGDLISDARARAEVASLDAFHEHVALDTRLAVYGVDAVVMALDAGAVQQLTVSDMIPLWVVPDDDVPAAATAAATTAGLRTLRGVPITAAAVSPDARAVRFGEWLLAHADDYGVTVNIVRDVTARGHELLHGYGGLAGIMHYPLDVDALLDAASGAAGAA